MKKALANLMAPAYLTAALGLVLLVNGCKGDSGVGITTRPGADAGIGADPDALGQEPSDEPDADSSDDPAPVTDAGRSPGKIYAASSKLVPRFNVWIPDGVPVVRAIVFNGNQTTAHTQWYWQEVATQERLAVVGTQFDVFKTDADLTNGFVELMASIAAMSSHPELVHAPLLLYGFSKGARFAHVIARTFPERAIAIGTTGSGEIPRTEGVKKIPFLTIFGEMDAFPGLTDTNKVLDGEGRGGALWATAIQWGRPHCTCNALQLILPFFIEVLHRRLPAEANSSLGPVQLLDIEENSGALGDRSTWTTQYPVATSVAAFPGDPQRGVWLPSAGLAKLWQGLVARKASVSIKVPKGAESYAGPLPAGKTMVMVDTGLPMANVQIFEGTTQKAVSGSPPYAFVIDLNAGVHGLVAVATATDGTRHVSQPVVVVVH